MKNFSLKIFQIPGINVFMRDNDEIREQKSLDIPLEKQELDKSWGRPLTVKQKKFVQEYLIDGNATRAYKAAGYGSNGNLKTPNVSAYQLLRNPRIQREIQHEMEERNRRVHIDQDKVLKELSKLAFSNIKRMSSWTKEDITFFASRDISDDDAAAIQEISINFTQFGANLKIKLYDKRQALVDLGNYLGLFNKDKARTSDPNEDANRIMQALNDMEKTMDASLREGKNGTK